MQNYGLTTSVMDYVPYEPLPRGEYGSPQPYFASPVVGAYDIAAMRYGHTAWRSLADATAFAESVAASGLALGVDSDATEKTDALAQQCDMSATPLEWHRHNVQTIQPRVQLLVRTARSRKASSAADLRTDVMTLVSNGKHNLIAASKLVGDHHGSEPLRQRRCLDADRRGHRGGCRQAGAVPARPRRWAPFSSDGGGGGAAPTGSAASGPLLG